MSKHAAMIASGKCVALQKVLRKQVSMIAVSWELIRSASAHTTEAMDHVSKKVNPASKRRLLSPAPRCVAMSNEMNQAVSTDKMNQVFVEQLVSEAKRRKNIIIRIESIIYFKNAMSTCIAHSW